ncbi:RNA-binding (RRM/RBD/RNP motifs) family protein [Actinidia rufa]|uniref:RNA-binding (RRM/RBD/RNP motifs) family protein n=1 Tax=Actinidia rufa TaxID=165716 RepID=A0A7J0EDN8_9ERIC|nr:RNA-binding (RRM/RBD/RNP motifs) family protein [Actinidia rufa]
MAAMPPSTISSALDESPSTPLNVAPLNRVAVAGSAAVVFFAGHIVVSVGFVGGEWRQFFSMPKMPTPSSSGLLLPKYSTKSSKVQELDEGDGGRSRHSD